MLDSYCVYQESILKSIHWHTKNLIQRQATILIVINITTLFCLKNNQKSSPLPELRRESDVSGVKFLDRKTKHYLCYAIREQLFLGKNSCYFLEDLESQVYQRIRSKIELNLFAINQPTCPIDQKDIRVSKINISIGQQCGQLCDNNGGRKQTTVRSVRPRRH